MAPHLDAGSPTTRNPTTPGDSHPAEAHPGATRTGSKPCLFEAGTRRMEAHKADQLAMAEIVEALHRGHGILSISEMSRLSGVTRQNIDRSLQHGGKEPRA